MAVYFTADTHFGHEKIIRYCKRPFHSAAEMDECIYANWATHVRPTDTVYHLGDVAFGDRDEVFRTVQRLRSLPGKKYLVPGNHDRRFHGMLSDAFEEVLPPIFETTEQLRSGGTQRLVLCHYPMMGWNGLYRGAVQLYGHVHGRIPGNSMQMDVGVDVWDFAPVRLETVLKRLSALPDFINPEIGMQMEDDDE
jgi:calcineurin-like phosphoesterase family protein